MSISRLILSIACSWSLVFAPSYAHEVWVDRVLLVHFGDVGERLDPIVPANLSRLVTLGADGAAVAAKLLPIGEVGAVVLPAGAEPALVAVAWDAGYRVKQGEKWVKAPAAEATAATGFRHTVFHSKTIFAWHPRFAQPVGHPLELVPLSDPLSSKVGGTLALRVVADGKPVAGAVIALDEPEVSLTSDADGLITVPLAKAGLHLLRARIAGTEGAGELNQLAVLAFHLKP
jgi:hypothetical protein